MKYACRYALVRFMPYPEIGEFANVGVILMSPDAKFFGFKMLEKGIGRITAFFDDLDPHVFRKARSTFIDELKRIQTGIEHSFSGFDLHANDISYVDFIFKEITRPRNAILFVDLPRVVLLEDPAKGLNDFFDHYVARAFAKGPAQERLVEQRIQRILKEAELTQLYHLETLGNDQYKARFPFVRKNTNGQVTHVIKPINLSHEDPSRLYDHGWEWVGKIRMLRKQNQLPTHVLFAAEDPTEKFGPRASAYAEVKFELERLEVEIAKPNEEEKILSFAAA